MSDAPPAAIKNATPAPGSNISSSPVSAASASSLANQQAAAAGEPQGLSNQDQAKEQQQPNSNETQQVQQQSATEGKATLENSYYQPSGNETIDQIGNLLYNKNIPGASDIVAEVIDTQELSLSSKAQLVEELGSDVAQLVINQLETSVREVKEAGEREGKRLKEYAFSKFGGSNPDDTWAGLQQFAQADASISAEERKTMNELLGQGGFKAQLVIDSLFNKYKDSSGYKETPTLMQGDMGTQDGFQYMSKTEYQQQIGPAITKYGEASKEVQALRNRRAISMSRGYN